MYEWKPSQVQSSPVEALLAMVPTRGGQCIPVFWGILFDLARGTHICENHSVLGRVPLSLFAGINQPNSKGFLSFRTGHWLQLFNMCLKSPSRFGGSIKKQTNSSPYVTTWFPARKTITYAIPARVFVLFFFFFFWGGPQKESKMVSTTPRARRDIECTLYLVAFSLLKFIALNS